MAQHEEVERLGKLSHELRNLLQTALLSFQVLKSGRVGITGSTGAVLGRSLVGSATSSTPRCPRSASPPASSGAICGGMGKRKADASRTFGDRRRSDRSGLGLGLSITRKAIKAIGGELHTRDLPGQGCVFAVDIPIAPAL